MRTWASTGDMIVINARQGKAARNNVTRFLRPAAGLGITIRDTPTNSDAYLKRPGTAGSENVVNGVKTIMVNEALRAADCVASAALPC